MESSIQASQVCLLVIFAHPDDETTLSGSTMAMYAASGAAVQILSATRGEQGGLGTGGRKIRREDLAAVREEELRRGSRHYRLERSLCCSFSGHNRSLGYRSRRPGSLAERSHRGWVVLGDKDRSLEIVCVSRRCTGRRGPVRSHASAPGVFPPGRAHR